MRSPVLMLSVLRGIRSLLSVLLVGLLFVLGSVVLRVVVIPGAWVLPTQRFRLITHYMKAMCGSIQVLLTLGGARFRRGNPLPTAHPALIVANHQSLLDITQMTLLAQPRVPAFVARSRYERFVPLVSASMRLLGSPIIDPRRDARGAVEAILKGARELPHGVVLFAEGHRSRDGSMRPFRAAGIEAVLAERRLPVYLVLNDGVWRVRRLADLLFRTYLIDGWSGTFGPFEAPTDPQGLPAFVTHLQETLARHLAHHRAGDETASAAR
jgi:1-acyl-sn-glycerol-3-phosphate acyltransferase